MFLRSFSSILIVTSAFVIAIGQTPETKKEKVPAEQTFTWHFQGDGAYLGVQTQPVTKENFARFGLREVKGVVVERMTENSPAAAAGIQTGDVILRFNGEDVTSARKLTRLIEEVDADHQVSITIVRAGSERNVTATLTKQPSHFKFGDSDFKFAIPPMGKLEMPQFDFKGLEKLKEFKGDFPHTFNLPDGDSFVWRAGQSRQIGVSVYPMTKQLGERFGVDAGVMINEVRENSPAAKAGLKAGDIIVEVGGKAVRNNLDLIKAIDEKKDGDVTVIIVRDRNRHTVTVTPEPSKDSGFFFHTEKDDGF